MKRCNIINETLLAFIFLCVKRCPLQGRVVIENEILLEKRG